MLCSVIWLWPQKTEPCETFHVLEYHSLKLHLTPLQLPPLTLCKFCTDIKRRYLKRFFNDRVSRKLIEDIGILSEFLSQYSSVPCYCQERVYFRVLWILPIESVYVVHVCFLSFYPVFFLIVTIKFKNSDILNHQNLFLR